MGISVWLGHNGDQSALPMTDYQCIEPIRLRPIVKQPTPFPSPDS